MFVSCLHALKMDSYPCSPHAYHLYYLLCFYDLEHNAWGCFQCRRKSIWVKGVDSGSWNAVNLTPPLPSHSFKYLFLIIFFFLFFSFFFSHPPHEKVRHFPKYSIKEKNVPTSIIQRELNTAL